MQFSFCLIKKITSSIIICVVYSDKLMSVDDFIHVCLVFQYFVWANFLLNMFTNLGC